MKFGHLLLICLIALVFPGYGASEEPSRTAEPSLDTQPESTPDRHALLVGVADYPSLAANLQLRGPKYDAVLMQRVLRAQGFPDDHVQMLATGVEGAGLPTRQAILDALAGLAERAEPGDFIYLHFGGHGSQQPAAADSENPEHDGLDETFLPMDVGDWDDTVGQAQGAITDNEMGAAIMAIRRKGAFVWVVFDSCHSGTMTRGAPADGVRYRKIEPWQLAKSKQRQDRIKAQLDRIAANSAYKTRGNRPAPESLAEGQVSEDRDMGGYVAFFAAQTTEVTPEMRLPIGDRNRESHGLFSFTVAEVLSSHPGISYRQAGQQILQRYASAPGNAPTPLFEGTHLDAPVFGNAVGEVVRQWPIRTEDGELSIPAGQLHQLGEGARLVVLAEPGAPDEAALGQLEVIDADLFQSVLSPTAPGDQTAIDPAKIPEQAYARLVDAKLDFTLRVALPAEPKKASDAERHAVALIRGFAEERIEGLNMQWVEAGKAADLRLAVLKDQLWMLSPSGELIQEGAKKSLSIVLQGKTDEKLKDGLKQSLQAIAKVTNLLRLSGGMGVTDEGVDLQFFVTPTCRANEPNCDPQERQVMPGAMADLLDRDRIRFVIKNQGGLPVDVTLLFIDGRYGIYPYYPKMGAANRIEAGHSKQWTDKVNAKTTGMEHMLVIAMQAQPNTERADFSFLAQPSLPATRAVRANASKVHGALEGMLREAGFGKPRSRGLDSQEASGRTTMHLFSWKVNPR